MSRSIHQTLRQIFFKKSKKEVVEMCDENNLDIDVIEWRKKSKIKNNTLRQRKTNKIPKEKMFFIFLFIKFSLICKI
jgi:hypothetical protein